MIVLIGLDRRFFTKILHAAFYPLADRLSIVRVLIKAYEFAIKFANIFMFFVTIKA
jgi:hypothetical protein